MEEEIHASYPQNIFMLDTLNLLLIRFRLKRRGIIVLSVGFFGTVLYVSQYQKSPLILQMGLLVVILYTVKTVGYVNIIIPSGFQENKWLFDDRIQFIIYFESSQQKRSA